MKITLPKKWYAENLPAEEGYEIGAGCPTPPCSASRLTPEGRRRISESSKRTYREGRLHKHDRAALEKMWKKSNAITRGTNGFGRQARGRSDHGRALVWTIQAPNGDTWTAANLIEWCRQNEDMFPQYLGATTPTAKRAADGLMLAYRRQLTWYGWSIISCMPNEPKKQSNYGTTDSI